MLLDAFVPVAGFGQSCEQLLDVLQPACLHRDVNGRVAQIHAVIRSVVLCLHDVGTLLGDDARQLVQRAWPIGEVNAKPHATAVFGEASFDDLRQ